MGTDVRLRSEGKQMQHELIVDNFAGGGGVSTGIEMAIVRCERTGRDINDRDGRVVL
jgi:hypothetical protein